MLKVTFFPSPLAPLPPPPNCGLAAAPAAPSLCEGLLGADVTVSLLLCLPTDVFIHKQLAVLLAF